MKLNREITGKINWVLDNLVPPILRDSRIVMGLPFFLLFGNKAKCFQEFKARAAGLTKRQIHEYYGNLREKHIERSTDLSDLAVKRIIENIAGDSVLDIACGSGFLAREIVKRRPARVVGVDFFAPVQSSEESGLRFALGDVEAMPFKDKVFDTVICAHTLEHTVHLEKAIGELRRVAKRRIIVVVPKQREYKYTFDLHLHFFPYTFSIVNAMGGTDCQAWCLGSEILYIENIQE